MSETFTNAEDAAGYLVLEYWKARNYASLPPTYPIFTAHHDNEALVVLGPNSLYPTVVVRCAQDTQGGWTAVGWAERLTDRKSRAAAVPPSGSGVFCWSVVPTASNSFSYPDYVRVVVRGHELHAPVIEHHAYYAHWLPAGTAGEGAANWQPGEFCVYFGDRLIWDAALQPPWLYDILCKPEEFAAAHQTWHRDGFKTLDQNGWASDLLFDYDNREEKLAAVGCLLESVDDVVEQSDYLGLVGAGALEDLMSDWLLDQIQSIASEPRWSVALLHVNMDRETPELQQRVRRFVEPYLASIRQTP
jgi:hypothetical protein